jgi:hypothetical protein
MDLNGVDARRIALFRVLLLGTDVVAQELLSRIDLCIGMALRKLALPAPRCVMIGDTPYDAEAGLEAGTKAAGVLTGGFGFDVLSEAGCLTVANDLAGLVKNLLLGDETLLLDQPDRLRSA